MINGRIARTAASFTLVLGGVTTLAPALAAATSETEQRSCWGQRELGSGGHRGNSVWCDGPGNYYRQGIECETGPPEFRHYVHHGPWMPAPRKSTAWCADPGHALVRDWME